MGVVGGVGGAEAGAGVGLESERRRVGRWGRGAALGGGSGGGGGRGVGARAAQVWVWGCVQVHCMRSNRITNAYTIIYNPHNPYFLCHFPSAAPAASTSQPPSERGEGEGEDGGPAVAATAAATEAEAGNGGMRGSRRPPVLATVEAGANRRAGPGVVRVGGAGGRGGVGKAGEAVGESAGAGERGSDAVADMERNSEESDTGSDPGSDAGSSSGSSDVEVSDASDVSDVSEEVSEDMEEGSSEGGAATEGARRRRQKRGRDPLGQVRGGVVWVYGCMGAVLRGRRGGGKRRSLSMPHLTITYSHPSSQLRAELLDLEEKVPLYDSIHIPYSNRSCVRSCWIWKRRSPGPACWPRGRGGGRRGGGRCGGARRWRRRRL